ncbi:division/cell wall cluster transcriptional repressor MraZ [Chloroflexota bacterium]
MFIGEFEYRVDEKGRVPIPPKYRQDLKGEGLMLMPGVEQCITAYPMSEWKKISDTLTTSGQITPNKMRKLNRAFFSTAFNIKPDQQGRITLPSAQRNYAGIMEDEVVIAGANNYFEIWDKTQWEVEKTNSQEEVWHIIESLEKH